MSEEYFTFYDSPLGALTLQSDGEYLTGVSFNGGDCGRSNKTAAPVLERTAGWLDIYFGGGVPDFTPPVRLKVSSFCREVCEILLTVPYGKTVTYGEIAQTIAGRRGGRMSAQAVGGAVHRNPVAIIIPCHRVIGADGSLTGYAAGLDIKAELLKLEKITARRISKSLNKTGGSRSLQFLPGRIRSGEDRNGI